MNQEEFEKAADALFERVARRAIILPEEFTEEELNELAALLKDFEETEYLEPGTEP